MKRRFSHILVATVAALGIGVMCFTVKGSEASSVMTVESDGTFVVNTTSLTTNVKGYNGTTPLMVYIKDDKVVKVEALSNKETPGYFRRLTKRFMHLWDGVSVNDAQTMKVDAATGATYSAKAVKANVDAALKYYKANKPQKKGKKK